MSTMFPLSGAPRLETERLILRAPEQGDIAPWMDFLTSPRGTWHGGGPTEGQARAWRIIAILTGHWAIHGFGVFVCVEKASGRPVASVGPFAPPEFHERELGWSTWDAADEGKGYAREAAQEVIRHTRDDLGWPSLVSYIDPENTRSVALAQALGATRDETAPRHEPLDQVWRHYGVAP